MTAEQRAHDQYAEHTANLDQRTAIHRYGGNPEPWPAFVRRHLPLRPGERILDVGAGTGLHWRDLDPEVPLRPVLVDRYWPMVEALRGLSTEVALCSAESLPFRDDAFDAALSTHVLYHLTEPVRAVREMLRVTRPGGWLAIATNGRQHLRRIDQLARASGVAVPAPHHLRFSIDDAANLLGQLGLSVERHDYDDELVVPGPNPVLAYLRTLGVPISDEAERLIRDEVEWECAEYGGFRIAKETGLLVASVPGPRRD